MVMLGPSWRTSLSGLIALSAAVGAIAMALLAEFDGSPETIANWHGVVEAIGIAAAAFGLLNARDDRVSTEQQRKGA